MIWWLLGAGVAYIIWYVWFSGAAPRPDPTAYEDDNDE